MNCVLPPRVRLLSCLALTTLIFHIQAHLLAGPAKPTIILVERVGGRTTYKVDGKPIGHVATDDILYALNQVAHRNGVDQPVYVYLDPRVPIEETWNFNGIASKAQLNTLRFFAFYSEDHKMMTEIKLTPFSPFTTSPPAN
jgi:hypothetical protein